MSAPNYSGYVLCSLTLSLFLCACRRNSESTDYPLPTSNPSIDQKKDSLLPKVPVRKRLAVKHRKKKESLRDTAQFVVKASVDTVMSTLGNDTTPLASNESAATKRFYLEQSLANSIRTPSSKIEPPLVSPDSQTWEQISGVPRPKEKIPDWKIALGYLRIVATIIGLVYIIFL